MTGVLNAVVGTGTNIYFCTVVDLGGGVVRAGAGGGIIVPDSPFKGADIAAVQTISTTLGFRISIDGDRPQSFFSKLVVQDTAGSFRTLTSASATSFSFGGVTSQWDWSVAGGTPLVWTASGGPHFLQLYP